MAVLELYQLAISHYCEKVRWALDYKQVEWRARNLLPGLHLKTAKRLTGQTSLPILVHDGRAIHDSSRILDHLDAHFRDPPLTPFEGALREEVLEWERFADADIGIDVRRICYHELLQYPDRVIPLMCQGGPWYGRLLLRGIFPQLQARMRRYMKINAAETLRSRDRLGQAIARVEAALEGRSYLVRDHFSRADLAVAALLAPPAMPPGYGVPWPAELPPALAADVARYGTVLGWVRSIYDRHRSR